MRHALELMGVSKRYQLGGEEVVALHEVDLTVAAGELVTLLGPSGSGKTTLLSIAGGLLRASSGRVVVAGQDITRARSRRLTAFRRRHVGFIFQAVNLVPFLSARENLLVVAELAGVSGRRRLGSPTRRADRLLEELGLTHRAHNLPSQLSGGERQRVAIGRALMNAPRLVLVDEPTSALDTALGQQVMELIVSELRARDAAAVVVTHDPRMARYGDRILNMADGHLVTVDLAPHLVPVAEPTPEPTPLPHPVAAEQLHLPPRGPQPALPIVPGIEPASRRPAHGAGPEPLIVPGIEPVPHHFTIGAEPDVVPQPRYPPRHAGPRSTPDDAAARWSPSGVEPGRAPDGAAARWSPRGVEPRRAPGGGEPRGPRNGVQPRRSPRRVRPYGSPMDVRPLDARGAGSRMPPDDDERSRRPDEAEQHSPPWGHELTPWARRTRRSERWW